MAFLSVSCVGKRARDAHVQKRTFRSLAAFRLADEAKWPIPEGRRSEFAKELWT